MTSFDSWIGRCETVTDIASATPLQGLMATLDHTEPPWPAGQLPPLAHWLYANPTALQSNIGDDGHPRRGNFLPPIALPRRMWAGSTVRFHAPVLIGAALQRRSTIDRIESKNGSSGELIFVTVRHDWSSNGVLALTEVQNIVYRAAAAKAMVATSDLTTASIASPSVPHAEWQRRIVPDPVLLFRYSALTFNGHRIHYDRSYCEQTENYPGLVVHGPLTATLLMDLYLREHPHAKIQGFSFRGRSPLFDIAPFSVCGASRTGGATLWALGPDGQIAMTAEIDVEQIS